MRRIREELKHAAWSQNPTGGHLIELFKNHGKT